MNAPPPPTPSTATRAVLAVDGGGTSTRAVVVTHDGTCLGYGASTSANPTSAGPTLAAEAILAACTAAIAAAAKSPATPKADGLWRSAVGAISGAAGTAGHELRRELHAREPRAHFTFEGDLLACFCSGSIERAGYVAIAGTGAVAARIADAALVHTVDGLGWLLGDDGSGFWIGHRVCRAVMAALDRRIPATALTDLLIDATGVTDERASVEFGVGRAEGLTSLAEKVYRMRPVEVARFAPLAFVAAAGGDPAAVEIVTAAAAALARTVTTVVDHECGGPLVVGGSVLAQQRAVRDTVAAAFTDAGGAGELIVVPDGTVGAAVIALRRAGVAVDPSVFATLRATVADAR